MDELLQKAIDRLDKETEELAKENPVMKMVGQMLTDFVTAHPEAAQCFLNEKKSLKDAHKAVVAVARKKEKGGVYYMGDAEYMDLVFDYYGIKDEDRSAPVTMPKKIENKPERTEHKKVDVGGLLEGL